MAAAYTFHLPNGAEPDDPGVAERAVVVRDAFSWGAFVTPMLWFFSHRHWLAGIGALLVVGLLAAVLWFAGFGAGTILLAELLLHWLIGLEAASIRRWLLARSGRAVADVVQAGSEAEAEVKGFARWVAREAAPPPVPYVAPRAPMRSASGPVIGLFPDLEGRRS